MFVYQNDTYCIISYSICQEDIKRIHYKSDYSKCGVAFIS